MTISVENTACKKDGASFSIGADPVIEVNISTRDILTSITGYIARHKQTNTFCILVDELLHDGLDEQYRFSSESAYEMILPLFWFTMPPNTTSLESIQINAYRVVPKG